MSDARQTPARRRPLGERLAFIQVPMWGVLLLLLAGFVLLLWFGGLVKHADTRGRAGKVADALVSVPHTLRMLWRDPAPFRPLYGGPYEPLPAGLWRNPDQPFTDPGYVLVTAFDDTHHRAEVHLLRLADGKVLHRWIPDIDASGGFVVVGRELARWRDEGFRGLAPACVDSGAGPVLGLAEAQDGTCPTPTASLSGFCIAWRWAAHPSASCLSTWNRAVTAGGPTRCRAGSRCSSPGWAAAASARCSSANVDMTMA